MVEKVVYISYQFYLVWYGRPTWTEAIRYAFCFKFQTSASKPILPTLISSNLTHFIYNTFGKKRVQKTTNFRKL